MELMSEWCARYKVQIWAYCLMLNHVHLIAVTETKDSLNLAIGEAHRRYTRRINFRERWRGNLWQGRFSSFILEQMTLRNRKWLFSESMSEPAGQWAMMPSLNGWNGCSIDRSSPKSQVQR
jgi:REP element-mobilizing transposase RayT